MAQRGNPNILIVLTSQERFGAAGRPTGFWLESFVAPYFLFKDAGIALTLTSPLGGMPPIDPDSRHRDFPTAARFARDECCRAALADTLMLQDVHAGDFDAAFYPGGFGSYWDLSDNAISAGVIADLQGEGKPVALVAQGVCALLPVRDPQGQPLVAGKRLTGFSDRAAQGAGVANLLPLSQETELVRLGAVFQDNGTESAVLQDGLLVTGATVAASAAVARSLLDSIAYATDTSPP